MSHPTVHRSRLLSRLNLCLIVAVICAAISHFLVVNDLSTKGFVFKDLKARSNELVASRHSMESRITALSSYQSLNPRIRAMSFVSADNVQYVSWDSQFVAQR